MDGFEELKINGSTYEWSVRVISLLKRLLSVNIKLHHNEGQLSNGEIFLFNHFARFETFIPQYLIYQEDGSYCRSIAADEFFDAEDGFSNYLLSVGAVPNKYPRLMPFLAKEILRGRKVIIFPEGGWLKIAGFMMTQASIASTPEVPRSGVNTIQEQQFCRSRLIC